ncbi:MAG: CapA family protein [Pseudobdellovibrionaceae bacterium]
MKVFKKKSTGTIAFILSVIFSVAVFVHEARASSLDLSYSASCDSPAGVVTFSFVGDILIHQLLYRDVVNGTQHFSQLWKRTEVLFNKADFSEGNLEGTAALGVNTDGKDVGDIGFVYDGDVYSGTNFLFNYHPRILSDLKSSGFDLLTLANNHALDRHSLGIDKTIAAARQVGLVTVGTRMSQDREGDFYQIHTIKNMRIAFLGCTEMTNLRPDQKNQILYCYNDETIKLIRGLSARSDVDATIVLTHWGDEYVPVPNRLQQTYARAYLDAGATAVIGSHPHVLQPWEKYITKDGRETFIAYSLGNFVAAQAGLNRKAGAVIYIGLAKDGNQKAKITGVAYTPTYRDAFEVYPVGNNGFNDVLKYVTQFFGQRGRIAPQDSILPALCRNNH